MRNQLAILILLAGTGACADYAQSGFSEERYDEIDLADVPEMKAQYGAHLQAELKVCKDDEACRDGESRPLSLEFRGIVDVKQDGAEVTTTLKLCSFDWTYKGDDYRGNDFFDAGVAGFGSVLQANSTWTMGPDGPLLQSDMAALVIGAKLGNEVGEDFPTRERDSRVIDQDDDGYAGVSLSSGYGRVILGMRFLAEFNLQQGADGSLNGAAVGHDFDLTVFDDWVPFVDVRDEAKDLLEEAGVLGQETKLKFTTDLPSCQSQTRSSDVNNDR